MSHILVQRAERFPDAVAHDPRVILASQRQLRTRDGWQVTPVGECILRLRNVLHRRRRTRATITACAYYTTARRAAVMCADRRARSAVVSHRSLNSFQAETRPAPINVFIFSPEQRTKHLLFLLFIELL